MKTKIIAMYLPQYHETEENNRWWGKGFTDWVSTRGAVPLFKGHVQPKAPLNDNYYDLSKPEALRFQVETAKKYGIGGFCFYHYWFSSQFRTLTAPAENLLNDPAIDIPFMCAWDNSSWIRTWSKFKKNANTWSPQKDAQASGDEDDGVLAKLEYGTKDDWAIHFNYLLPFFKDGRYIKISGAPVFIFWNNFQKEQLAQMRAYWNELAVQAGFSGMYFITRDDPYKDVGGFDSLFNYEPQFSGWLNIGFFNRAFSRVKYLLGRESLKKYSYDAVWRKIIGYAENHRESFYGGFVNYDDTPRRGNRGKVVVNGSPEKFEKYLKMLYDISCDRDKQFLFLTAWNEWGEGAFLEPDKIDGYSYLEAIRRIVG